jgi:hypothetical protein
MLPSKYNGALLYGDNNLLVVDDKSKKKFISVEEFSHLKNPEKYYSYYKGLKGKFKIVPLENAPRCRYEIGLVNHTSFTCSSNHKAMVYRTKDKSERGSSELLSIEFIEDNFPDTPIYIPWKNTSLKEDTVDIAYMAIESISRDEHIDSEKVYGIIFKEDSPSVLLMLSNGIVVKGDKE